MLKKMSAQLISRSVKNRDNIRAISLSFAVKSLYRSSQINNFSYQKLSVMFNISRETAKKRILTLKKLGLIRENDKHMIFLSFSEIGVGIKNIYIQNYSKIKNIHDLKEVEKFIRLQGVFIKQSQIDYAANILKAKECVKTNKERKAISKCTKKLSYWVGSVDRGQSINTVSKASGLSKKSAVELLKWADNKKLITKTLRITPTSFPAFGENKISKQMPDQTSYFVHKGCVFSVLPTVLTFSRKGMV
jgi:hypothetical protein